MTSDPSSPSSQRDPSSQPGSPAQPSATDPTDPTDPGAAGPDADADRLAAVSPATPAAELARIAASRPDLHPALAANPATYPDLVDWLRTSPDPAVQAALARRTTPPAQPEPTQTTPTQAEAPAYVEAPTRATGAAATPSPIGMPAPPARAKRKTGLRRPAVIAVVLVAVLVLVGAAGVGFHFLSSKGRSQSGSAPTAAPQPSGSPSSGPSEGGMISPDPSWADGAHEVWSLDGRMITTAGDQLFVAESGEDGSQSSVIAYSISGSEPEKQWEAQVHGASMYSYGIWGDYLTVGHQLIERSDGRVTEAPWSVNPPLVAIVDDMAIACYSQGSSCEAWRSSDISSRAWSATIEGALTNIGMDGAQAVSRTNTHVGDRTILALSPKMLVDVDTGETFDLSAEGYRAMAATTDGWVAYNGSEYALLSPTGEKRSTFGGSAGVTRFTATPSQERPSGEQYRKYLEDGDLSWAEVSVKYAGLGADGCEATIAVGNTIVKGKVQSISNCLAYPSLYIVSDDEKILMAAWEEPFSPESASIMGAWTIADQKPIEFPGSDADKDVFRLAGPSLMISSDSAGGRITAYTPGKK